MSEIVFDNSFARLSEGFFARVLPDTAPNPRILAINDELASELGIDPEWLRSPAGMAMLSGGALPDGADPIAMIYAGHQFGGWSPQLGDGRALLLGEVIDRSGERRDVQLKGSGRTPFSRQGDGKAPLGPVLREYLVSEAMFAFGVPTTRALAAVATGEEVYRDTALPGAILARVARSHIRVGTFQYFQAQGETERLAELTDYVIDRHYPEARKPGSDARAQSAYALLVAIIQRQARLIAQWMQFGFIHGVMNTDNMQIAGETIDFGPCAFMERFNAETVLSSIDRQGRYAWCNQAGIGQWNLTRLAEALLPLLAPDEDAAIEKAKDALALYGLQFNRSFLTGFREKLGLLAECAPDDPGAQTFLDQTFSVLTQEKVDFTLFFRRLTRLAGQGTRGAEDEFLDLFENRAVGSEWLTGWREAVQGEIEAGGGSESASLVTRAARMRAINPIFIPRNHRVEEAIQASLRGDDAPFHRLRQVLQRPFDEQPEHAELERPASAEEEVKRTFCGT